jgi:hypothetical protein
MERRLQIELNTTYRKYKDSAHMFLVAGQLSHLDFHHSSRSQKTTSLSSVDYMWKLCFYVGTIQNLPF